MNTEQNYKQNSTVLYIGSQHEFPADPDGEHLPMQTAAASSSPSF